MKKLILMATVVIAAVTFQSAKAQVNLNINIGTQPTYLPVNYAYASHSYRAPERHYVYVDRRRPVYHQPVVYRAHYAKPANRYYAVRQTHYRPMVKHIKYKKVKSNHGKRH